MGIRIIGTGHIFEKSVAEVTNAIASDRPDYVAIELDIRRFHVLESVNFNPSMLASQASLKDFLRVFQGGGGSLTVFMQYFLGLIQKDLGKTYGLAPGVDMCAAIVSARSFSIPVALIDRDIEVTMNKVMNVPLKDLAHLASADESDVKAISSLVQSNIENILEKDNLENLMNQLRNKHPTVYAALVDERDRYMAYKLANLQKQNPEKNILAVVGAGHSPGITKYLTTLGAGETIDLKPLNETKKISPFKAIILIISLIGLLILMKIQSFIPTKKQ
jgi:pheromone shutdown-related protein TraB